MPEPRERMICPIMSARVFDDDGGPERVYCHPETCAWGIYYHGRYVPCKSPL